MDTSYSQLRQNLKKMLVEEIKTHEQHLYTSAKVLENSKSLRNEMIAWDNEFGGDGLEDVYK